MSDPYRVTDEMISDVFTAALDPGYGGSEYWARYRRIKAPDRISLRDFDNSDGKTYVGEYLANGGWYAIGEIDEVTCRVEDWHPLTREGFAAGIRKAARRYGFTPARFYEEHDAGTADVALQLAVLGEITYG